MLSQQSQNVAVKIVPRAVLLCWFAFLALSALGGAIMDHLWSISSLGWWRWTVETMVISFLCGQLALATMIAGLAGRSWVASWMGAVLLACIHTAVMIAVSGEGFWHSDRWAICTLWPALLLSTCAPLVLLRVLIGWTLARQSQAAIPRWSSSLEDLMMVGVVIASAMTTTQVMVYAEGPRGFGQLLLIMLVFAGVSFLCIPITVYVSFRLEPLWKRVTGWLILTGLTFVAIYCSAAIVENDWSSAYRNLPYICIGVPTGCLTVLTGILAIRAGGYQLTYFESVSAPLSQVRDAAVGESVEQNVVSQTSQVADSWLDDGEDGHAEKKYKTFSLDTKWQARIATAIIVGAAAMGGISIQIDRQRDLNFYRQLVDEKIQGAKVQYKRLVGLSFSPEFKDSDLLRYTKYAGDLDELSLAGTKVTDEVFLKLNEFSSLTKLDLSRTNVTSQGLLSWQPFSQPEVFNRQLARLSLADTKVYWPALASLKLNYSVKHLDMSGLGITDEQLKQPIRVKSLSLARNPISNEGIQSLLETHYLDHLDLTDLNIDGSTLANNKCPSDLVLDGTQITDATLAAILATGRVRKLSIARTKITSAMLNQLGSVVSLRLGEGLITDRDLVRGTPRTFEQLSLNGKQFTGDCFKNGSLSSHLILSGSSIGDEAIGMLVGTFWIQTLDLSGTQVTDRSVPFLRAGSIDLRDTRVTAKGLRARQMYGDVTVSLGMFKPEEMSELSRNNVHIGYASFPESDDLW